MTSLTSIIVLQGCWYLTSCPHQALYYESGAIDWQNEERQREKWYDDAFQAGCHTKTYQESSLWILLSIGKVANALHHAPSSSLRRKWRIWPTKRSKATWEMIRRRVPSRLPHKSLPQLLSNIRTIDLKGRQCLPMHCHRPLYYGSGIFEQNNVRNDPTRHSKSTVIQKLTANRD